MPGSICQTCGTQVPQNARFCPSCGKEVAARVCQACGAQVPEGSHFCPSCGKEVVLPPRLETQPSRVVPQKMEKEKKGKEAGKKSVNPVTANIMAVIVLVVVFPILFLVILFLLDDWVSVSFPHPFYNGSSRITLLSNPNFNGSTAEVSPRELQKTIDGYSYGRKYQVGVFDCSDMSIALARYLEEKGYDTSVIGDDNNVHAWVYVWTDKNRAWAIEATANVLGFKGGRGGGEIIGDEWWDMGGGYRGLSGLTDLVNYGNAYEFYYPTTPRSGLHVFEWHEVGPGR